MLSLLSVNQSMYQSINLSSSQSHTHVDVKQRFYVFFCFGHFYVFNVFYFPNVFLFFKENVGKIQSGKQINKKHF